MPVFKNYRADIPYRQLPDRSAEIDTIDPLDDSEGAPFFDQVEATAFPQHILRYRNDRASKTVGLQKLSEIEWIAHFGRFEPLPDNLPYPHCMRYHGHQFRHYNPGLGDGRGFLFAQLRDDKGRLLDLGTKGSGTTPYSRAGDGRLTLKGAVREILATEMLEALGVDTSKTFSIIETGEALQRNDEPSPTRSAVMVRLNHSHIRFGTFQMLAAENQLAAMERLVDYCIAHFYPDITETKMPERVLALFDAVVGRVAGLAASWMAAGFVHGVLNTDNMNITGESFDYGPWRFTEFADPQFTAAYFDEQGLYAYGRQADAVSWNLAQLANVLAQIAPAERLGEILNTFPKIYNAAMVRCFFTRLGVRADAPNDPADSEFVMDLLRWMGAQKAPIEQVFFDWFGGAISSLRAKASPIAEKYAGDEWQPLEKYLKSLPPERPERLNHEYFARKKPCTMLIDEVEDIWAAIDQHDDWQLLNDKLTDIGVMRDALAISF